MEVKIQNREGKAVGSTTLLPEVFKQAASAGTINDVVKAQLNNARQGTVKTKTRGHVAGGGRKPWRQKGTGRARQGSTRSPIWPGGGCTFGPLPKTYDHRPPKKMVDRALCAILSDKAANQQVKVLDSFGFESGKARDVRALMAAHQLQTALFVVEELTEAAQRATRNFKNLKLTTPLQVSPVDLLKYQTLVLTEKAKKALEEELS